MSAPHRFRAMGTLWEILLDAPEGPVARAAIAAAEAEVRRLEALLSRFRPDSELSRLNRARRLRAGADLLRVTAAALDLRRRTRGLFDPAVGGAVRAAGYDRPFGELPPDGPAATPAARTDGAVALDPGSGLIALGPGVELDLGGIAKGDAADRACALAAAAGPALVSGGGDVRVSGPRARGPWPVGIACADGARSLALSSGAVATSGTDRRRWRRGGRDAHHLIDPRAGAPAATPLVRVTAAAPTGAEADAYATALLVGGVAAADLATSWGVPAALVDHHGTLTLAGGLA